MRQTNVASIPRSEKILGRANCQATDVVSNCVKLTGPKVGRFYQVSKMNPTISGELRAVGIIIRKISSTECVVQFSGPMKDVYTGLTTGRDYYVGPGSTLVMGNPGIENNQLMGAATSSNEFLLAPGNFEVDVGGFDEDRIVIDENHEIVTSDYNVVVAEP